MNIRQYVKKNLKVKQVMGHEYLCLCPYHNDSNASFCVNVRKGVFVCYSCGKKGTMKDLQKFLRTGVQFETVAATAQSVQNKILALKNPVPKQEVKSITPEEVAWWQVNDQHVEHWEKRNISSQTMEIFSLGYDTMQDALVMPVHDMTNGKLVSAIRRNLDLSDGSPKYKYMKGFRVSHHLYGGWQCVTSSPVGRLHRIAIVEGPIDSLAMWDVGLPAVAILGASASVKQVNLLKSLSPVEYVIMTDRDTAGRQAAMKIEKSLRGSGIIVTHPDEKYWTSGAKDADELMPEDRIKCFENTERKTWV
jgi:DNA primase